MEIFSSRDSAFKTPYGAVKIKQEVRFSIRLPRELGITSVRFFADSDTGEHFEQIMPWSELERGIDIYTAAFKAPDTPCILYYGFRAQACGSEIYLRRRRDGTAEISRDFPQGALWQLTVYYANDKSASGMRYGEGITYHIFADRFAKAADSKDTGNNTDEYKCHRKVHENWDDTPDFLPDENGEITNNDFFGGNIRGIIEKLPYLKELSVSTIYLSPIFESCSNHRYDTGDYMKIDPMLGTEKDFSRLCRAADKLHIRVILDGVFNHTGSCSRYFNKTGAYDSIGAYQSQQSPYIGWYDFERWNDKYSCWWGILTLPQVNEKNEDYRRFIIDADDSVIKHWLRAGASGWRLDVADELPDDFISRLCAAARRVKRNAVIIGEVWEDATTKISYGERRRYILNGALDGVMNYPLYNAILSFLRGADAYDFVLEIEQMRENYPHEIFYSLMNHIGTHDTARILTLLGCREDLSGFDKSVRAEYRLSSEDRARGISLLKLASLIQFCFPGSPTIYYGDEAGMEGFEDPLNRRAYPWGHECREILDWYKKIGKIRSELSQLKKGDFSFWKCCGGGLLVFSRSFNSKSAVIAVNRGEFTEKLKIKCHDNTVRDLISGAVFASDEQGVVNISVPPVTGMIIV